MRVLITGGSGMLGSQLNKMLSEGHDIITIYNKNIGNTNNYNSVSADINDLDQLSGIFNDFRPEIVIHTASIASPAEADNAPHKLVFDTNVASAANIAKLCNKLNSRLIYTSTDLVYGGYRGTMLDENSKLVPISLYAETKLMGEVKIQEYSENYLVLRMPLMFGIGEFFKKNHLNTVYDKLIRSEKVQLFDDQFRTPLSFYEAANIIKQIIIKDISKEIINVGGLEKVSRFELGKILCEEAGFDLSLLIPNKMSEVDGIYKVADVSMNTGKLTSYGVTIKNLREQVKQVLGEL